MVEKTNEMGSGGGGKKVSFQYNVFLSILLRYILVYYIRIIILYSDDTLLK